MNLWFIMFEFVLVHNLKKKKKKLIKKAVERHSCCFNICGDNFPLCSFLIAGEFWVRDRK